MRGAGSKAVAFTRSLLLLGALVVGVPWLLVLGAQERFGGAAPLHGVPAPTDWEAARIRDALTDRLTDDTIADVVIRASLVVAWLAVGVVVVTVVAEAVHMIRHDGLPMPPVRGLGGPQALARIIAAGLLVVVPLLSGPSKAVARDGTTLVPEPRPSAVAEYAVPTSGDLDARPDQVWWSKSDVGSGQSAEVPSPPVAAPSPTGHYVVRAGDSIYAIAERLAGPDSAAVADYADALLELNLGRSMNDGQRFTNAAYIDVGWVLQLPPSSAEVAADDGAGRAHVVERGESLWSIAEDELGDAQRWPEIYEANRGRTFADGRVLDDPDLIHPGWRLEVPGQARPADRTPVAPAPSSADAIAPAVDDRPMPAEESAATPTERVESAAPGGPNATVEESGTAAPDQVWERSPAAGRSGAAAGPGGDADDSVTEHASSLLTLGHAAMLSAGVLTLLAVRRRQQLRRARPRETVDPPAPRPAATERALRSTDTGERLERLTGAIDAAAPGLVTAGQRLVAALLSPDGAVELIASGAISLTAPWQALGSDRWAISAATPIELIATSPRPVTPCPALVQLGRHVDGRDVYVDLEALEALEVGGPADDAQAIVAAIAMTLAGSVAAEVTTLVGLGIADEAFLGHRLHRPVRDAQRAFAEAADAIGATAAATRSTFDLRANASGGEAWEPAVVLIGAAAGPISPPPKRTGLAVVSASPITGPSSRLAPEGAAWRLLPLDITLTPVGLRPAEVGAVAELVRMPAAEPATELPSDQPPDVAPPDVAPPDDAPVDVVSAADDPDVTILGAADRQPAGPAWSLLVRMLGGVDVVDRDGRAVEFERSKTRELVAWLATHRTRSTRSAARTALWELDVRDATFNNVVSEARRALARLVEPLDGEEWVGRTMTDALPLHDLVRTDAELLGAALDVSRVAAPDEAIAALTPAVELIRGLPFEGTSYLWPDSEGLTSELVLLATTAAAELAAHCLSVGDTEGVFDATGRGLQVLPGHEELIGLRMRAHARVGDHAGVRHEWESYERVIVADPWSDGEPSPKLVELRRNLLSPSS